MVKKQTDKQYSNDNIFNQGVKMRKQNTN